MVQLTFQVPRPSKSRDSNDPIKVERSQSMKSFRDILSSRSVGDYAQVCNTLINGTTHLSSATPTKVTDSNDPIKVERSQSMKSFRDILSSKSGGDYMPVYNKLNCTTHLSSAKTTRCHCYFTAISVVILLLAYLSGTTSANLCNSWSFSLGIVTILLLPHTL